MSKDTIVVQQFGDDRILLTMPRSAAEVICVLMGCGPLGEGVHENVARALDAVLDVDPEGFDVAIHINGEAPRTCSALDVTIHAARREELGDAECRLRRISGAITAFDKQCQAAEHTDSGDAWELLNAIREIADGEGELTAPTGASHEESNNETCQRNQGNCP